MLLRSAAFGGMVASIGVTAYYVSVPLAVWLLTLAGLTYFRPVYGVAVLFLVISIDQAAATFGGIVVGYSEIEFFICLLAWSVSVQDLKKLQWRCLLWGAPFLGAVALSGLANIDWYKVPPHLLRSSELILALFLAENVVKQARIRQGASFRRRAVDLGPGQGLKLPETEATPSLRYAVAAAAFFFPLMGLPQYFEVWAGRIFSYFNNANQFAGYLAMLLPFLAVFFFETAGRWSRLLWAYSFVVGLAALAITLSRGAVLGALVSLTLIWCIYYWGKIAVFFANPFRIVGASFRRSGVTVCIHTLFFLAAGLYLAFGTSLSGSLQKSIEGVTSRSNEGFISSFKNQRLPYLAAGWEMWKDHPLLGVGPGRYDDIVSSYLPVVDRFEGKVKDVKIIKTHVGIHVHNLYLQLAIDLGLVGLVAFFWLLRQTIGTLLRSVRDSPWPLAGLGLLVGFMIHNLFDVTFPSLGFEMGLLAGMSLGYTLNPSRDNDLQIIRANPSSGPQPRNSCNSCSSFRDFV